MKTRKFMLFMFLAVLVGFKCSASKVGSVKLSRDSSSYDLQAYCEVMEIDIDSIQISQLLSGKVTNWGSLGNTITNKIYWGKVSLNNTDSLDANYVLEFGLNSYIDLYIVIVNTNQLVKETIELRHRVI